jgi:hypothetical protein
MLSIVAILLFTLYLAVPNCGAQEMRTPFVPDSEKLQPNDLKQILGQLCPGQEISGYGCHVCPQESATPGGRADSFIESAVRGHFLSPDSDDLVVVLVGCSPHAGLSRNIMLFTRSTDGWFFKGGGGPMGRCHKIANRRGRDGLFCFIGDAHYGIAQAWLSFAYLTSQKQLEGLGSTTDERSEDELPSVLDNRGWVCLGTRLGEKVEIVESAIERVQFLPGPTGETTVRISATCGRGVLSPQMRKRCQDGALEIDARQIRWTQPPRAFRIDYGFDGEHLSLAPGSRAEKRVFDACSRYPE